MIDYEYIEGRKGFHLNVRLDSRVVGRIRPIETDSGRKWQYFPNRAREGGELFPSLDECKRSLEGVERA